MGSERTATHSVVHIATRVGSAAMIVTTVLGCAQGSAAEDHWTNAPKADYSVELDGTAIKWRGPKGLVQRDKKDLSVAYDGGDEAVAAPEIRLTKLGAYYPVGDAAVDKDVRGSLMGYTVSRQEKSDKGYLYVTHNESKSVVKAQYYTYGPGFHIKCFGSQSLSRGFEDVDKVGAVLADACSSIAADGIDLSAAGGKKPAAAKAALPPPVLGEMKAFLAMLDGKSATVDKALKKFTARGVKTADMQMYNLADGTVTQAQTKGDTTCYSMEAKSGMTVRQYELCWKGGKIVRIADRGMKPPSL